MKAFFSRIATIVLCATFMVGFVKSSNAVPKVGDRIGDWNYQCKAVSEKQNICALIQTLINSETKDRVLTLVLRRVGKDKKLALFATAPLGIYLAAGIAGKVDDGKPFTFKWQRCTTQGCQAMAVLNAELEQALKAGDQLLIGYEPQPNAQTIALGASLKGLAMGLKALEKE